MKSAKLHMQLGPSTWLDTVTLTPETAGDACSSAICKEGRRRGKATPKSRRALASLTSNAFQRMSGEPISKTAQRGNRRNRKTNLDAAGHFTACFCGDRDRAAISFRYLG